MTVGQTVSAMKREGGFFTMVEVLLATLVLALSATATAYWVETVGNLSRDANEQTVGTALVQVMEAVISPLAFREPGTTVLGPESGENLSGYDDIDDFHQWVASPPIDVDRNEQSELEDWQVHVQVEPVDQNTLATSSSGDLRRVRVYAEYRGKPVAQTWWLRARSPSE